MLDIVIPTMVHCDVEGLKYSITQAMSSENVSRIIIIDNSGESKFSEELDFHPNIDGREKLIVRTMEKNIFVNPAWNLGVSLCSSPNVLIMNDDIFCHKKVYHQVNLVMDQFNVGICSVTTKGCYNTVDYLKYIDDFEDSIKTIGTFEHPDKKKSGWFFCVKKTIWKDIPSELKIFYGDDLIFQRTKHLGYESKNITSCTIGHMGSGTVMKSNALRPTIHKVLREEHAPYQRHRKKYVEE